MTRRIVLAIVSVATVAILAFAVPLGIFTYRLYREEEIEDLRTRAATASGLEPTAGLRESDPPAPNQSRYHKGVGLYDSSNHRVFGDGPKIGDKIVRHALTGALSSGSAGGSFVAASPILENGKVVGVAACGREREHCRCTLEGNVARGVRVRRAGGDDRGRRGLAPDPAPLATGQGPYRRTRAAGRRRLPDRVQRSQIPELDRAAEALEVTATRLGEVLTREREFSANASHQLSSPLTGLRVTLEGALMTPGQDLEEAIRTALGEVDRLQSTVDGLLKFARDGHTDARTADVVHVVSDATVSWKGRFGGRCRGFWSSTCPSRCQPRGVHPIRCASCCKSWSRTLSSTGAAGWQFAVELVHDSIVIEVEDEGPGITGDVGKVFERRSHQASGHGIGLALARSLASVEGVQVVLRRAGPAPVFALVIPLADDEGPARVVGFAEGLTEEPVEVPVLSPGG